VTSAVVIYESPDQVRKDIDAIREQVMEVLPAKVDADRFLRVVAKAVIENPRLMECTRLSLLAAVHEAAQLGLEPSGLLGSAYLVPYRMRREVNGKWQTVHEAKLIPGYRGLIDLARRSGEIRALVADVWRLADTFDYERTRQPEPIIHRPFIPDPTADAELRDRGPIVGAYMLAFLTSGYVQPEVMFADEIESIRKRSKAADDGPWITDYSEMARKTVVRRGSKYLPLTSEFRRALELDEEAEREAEAPTPARPMSRAKAMLVERAGGATETPALPEGGNGTPPEDSEVAQAILGADAAIPAGQCGAINDDLGACIQPEGHQGSHGNDQGRWPNR
jgi:recombination protein RecT